MAAAALVAMTFAANSCGTEGASTFEGGPCETVYKGLCGGACTTDDTCAAGLHCSADKQCTAACTPGGGECAQGTCTARGQCFFGTGSGFGEGGLTDGGGGGPDACIDLVVDLTKVTPTVMLLVDQSSSMTIDFGGVTRWNAVRGALMDVNGGIVKSLENDVRFGLALYTRQGPFPQGADTCPRLPTIAAAISNHTQINDFYKNENPIQGTPTGESIDKLIGRKGGVLVDGGFASLLSPGPKVLVLATDGEPDTCANGDDVTNGRLLAVSAAQAAFQAGIRTYVIAVGDSIAAAHLKEMANAGAGQPLATGTATPFTTGNRQEFVNAMNEIIFGVRSCVFTLGGSVTPGNEARGSVTLEGAPLAYQAPDGWRLNTPSELEVLGTSCTKLKTTNGKLAVSFPCGAFGPR